MYKNLPITSFHTDISVTFVTTKHYIEFYIEAEPETV